MLPLQNACDELKLVAEKSRRYFTTAAGFSLGINLLFLATPLYSLQVYDRVLNSGSKTTLVLITLILLVALLTMTGLDHVRSNILVRMGVAIDRELSERVLGAHVDQALAPGANFQGQVIRDVDNVRQFVTSVGIHSLFDAPWMPVYLGVLFLVHPLLGGIATLSALVLLGLALMNEVATKELLEEANRAAGQNYRFADASLRNSEVIRAMGMVGGLVGAWGKSRKVLMSAQATASSRGSVYLGWIKFARQFVQSLMLGAGAYLVIEQSITAGAMFASSFILGRALAPVEQGVGVWKQFVSARSSLGKVNALLKAHKAAKPPMPLPPPRGALSVDRASFGFPRSDRMILKGVNFALPPGTALGVVGPSAAGKSTLARLLVGVWKPVGGAVRLDGADIFDWARGDLGRHVGYLPQDIELFPGTVRQNIERFTEGDPAQVVAAAKDVEVHDLILQLPNGYETEIGENGAALSGGQRQRVALARAVYGNPSYVVLDEPNSNLDTEGEEALRRLLVRLKQRQNTVIIISHRPSVLSVVDMMLVLRDGAVDMFGPRDEVLAKLAPPRAAPPPAAVAQPTSASLPIVTVQGRGQSA